MNKSAVAQSFSAAAEHYDSVAHLQRQVADELMKRVTRLPMVSAQKAVDLGTGTGYLLPALDHRFNPRELFGLDLSNAMLHQAKHRHRKVITVQADLEQPPFQSSSIDLAVSSLAVQWLECPMKFVEHAFSMLTPGGYLALATVGPKTLSELKTAWQSVDEVAHVNQFNSAQQWRDAISDTGFVVEHWQESFIEVLYDHPLTLLNELKILGANHVDRNEQPKVSSVRKMLRAYQPFRRQNSQYPATWEIFYIILKKPN
ncbi:malonyl-ACP O-methyltransferase BioC [Reinekea marina]|uniref:Malonyl-[acyl-carrier protein] O-methyltransferase n=2 Tax=Reinekea marina TaxID=1310421 RepID=A0ABV7WRM8_9GAMM